MSVTKKDKKWVAKGTVCLPNGEKRHYNRQFDLKKDAIAYEAARREELQCESPSMTLDAFVRQQDELDKLRIKNSSMLNRSNRYKNHIQPAFGKMRLTAIKPAQIQRWYQEFVTEKGLTIATADNALGFLSAYMAAAYRMGLVSENPCKRVMHMKQKSTVIDDRPDNYWTKDEYELAMKYCPDSYKLMMELLWRTGLRMGEAVALQWQHVHGNRIEIVQQYSRATKEISTPKTNNSVRTIRIDYHLQALLEEQYLKLKHVDGFNDEWFVTRDYRMTNSKSFADALHRLCKKSGVKEITPHGLRHSHASILINAGISDVLIADRLGHTVNVLQRVYAHIYESKRDEVGDELDLILG